VPTDPLQHESVVRTPPRAAVVRGSPNVPTDPLQQESVVRTPPSRREDLAYGRRVGVQNFSKNDRVPKKNRVQTFPNPSTDRRRWAQVIRYFA
jgi:hypothetical protein